MASESVVNDVQKSLPRKAENMAKAHLRFPEMAEEWKPLIGDALRAARQHHGWTLNELAGKMPHADGRMRDDSQVRRWESGEERPQLDVLLSVKSQSFRYALILELAQLVGLEVETFLRIPVERRRRA